MSKQDLVSIVMATYNRARLLPQAIESVLNQTYQNIEFIIIDDGSQDGTQELISRYRGRDKRIVYLKNAANKGQSHSLNAGIENSRGDFLMFLDDDCEYLPGKVDTDVALMQSINPSPSLIYDNMWVERVDGKTTLPLNKKDAFITAESIFSCNYTFLDQSTWFCKKACIKGIGGFDRELSAYNDIDLLMRLLVKGEKIYFHNYPLSIKHKAKGVSTVSQEFINKKEKFLQKHLSLLENHKAYISRFYYGIGKDLLSMGSSENARHYFWKAFSCDPLKIEYIFRAIFLNGKK